MKQQNTGRRTRIVEVARSERLTPTMQRVTLCGEDLADFPAGQESAHIKLLIPQENQSLTAFRDLVESKSKAVARRTYTVRHHRADTNELDVDFVVHDGGGPACSWALAAGPGDFIGVAGPGPKKKPVDNADWYLFGADMAAIPAAAAALEELPDDAVGHAVFEITCDDDIQPVDAPDGIQLHWLVHEDPHTSSEQQLEFFRSIDWPKGTPGIFVAGESGAVSGLRKYLTNERGLDKRAMYISAYWKIGLIEDQHQVQKQAEAA
ncbi:siderophore-interacting protein [Hoeflea sp. TYP-13]|uniref:siderophore-interacting protein n=1 Tax=Hoeflea sp. TYP-13 TaxID=3230023 RepID=UPI0034C66DEC